MKAYMSNMKITIRQLRCFEAVIACGNFSRAAERLNTSQPALSQAMREMEQALGVKLFDRTTRRVELTAAGQVFRETALDGLSGIDRAVQLIQDMANLRAGHVRIAAPPLLAATIVPRIVSELYAQHPELAVSIEDVGTDFVAQRVRSSPVTLGIGTFNPDEEGLSVATLARDRLHVFVSASHPLARAETVSWRQIADAPIVTMSRESGLRRLVEFGFETASVQFRPRYEINQIFTALALVDALNDLIAVLPAYGAAAISGRDIVARPLVDPEVSRPISMARVIDRSPSAAMNAVSAIAARVVRNMIES